MSKLIDFLDRLHERDPEAFLFFSVFVVLPLVGGAIAAPCLTAYQIAKLFA